MTTEACLLASELSWPPDFEETRVNLSRQRTEDKPCIYLFTCSKELVVELIPKEKGDMRKDL